jgi:AraC-like DNA-binding protein
MCFVREAVLHAEARGFDVKALLLEAGMSPDLLPLSHARVSPQHYGKMWHLLARAMDDEFFGMDSHPVRYGSFTLACYCAIGAESLGQALRRVLRFYGVVMNDLRAVLELNGDLATIRIVEPNGPQRLFSHGTLLVILHGLACWLMGRRIPIRRAAFAPTEPDHIDEYRLIFGSEIKFGCVRTELSFDAGFLDLHLVQKPGALKSFLRDAPSNFLVKYRNRNSLMARVRQVLREVEPATWPDFSTLARRFHMTETTLRRRLDSEGQSYQIIKDNLRHDLAIQLLSHSDLSVQAISAQLGFAEPSAFHRAFRKWTGTSPRTYRSY